MRIFSLRYCGAALLLAGVSTVFAQQNSGEAVCGSLQASFGPHDYRVERGFNLKLVEGAHFGPEVEALVRGQTNRLPSGDLEYTLRAFPNHHRALVTAMRWSEKAKSPQPPGMQRPVECYFDRAIRFRPDDVIVRIIYATFLTRNNRRNEAIQQLETATGLAKDNGFTHYNIGLNYLEMKAYDRALVQAHAAMALGFAQTALKDGLVAAGQWKDPVAAPAASPAPAADPAAAPQPAASAAQ